MTRVVGMKALMILATVAVMLFAACSPQQSDELITGRAITLDENFDQVQDTTVIEVGDEVADNEEFDMIQATPEEQAQFSIIIDAVEGDLIDLNPRALDPDGDQVTYTFTGGGFSENGLWQTVQGDAGKYQVKIAASDGDLTTYEDILVVLSRGNRAPIVNCPASLQVREGEEVVLGCTVVDADSDELDIQYSGWMEGRTKQTTFDDAGEYIVIVTARDAQHETSVEVPVRVTNVNRQPVIEPLEAIVATERDVVTINPTVFDPDGDALLIEYSEPFSSEGVWVTRDGDSGEYLVTLTATDGEATASAVVNVRIADVNTPPVLEPIPDITVNEGDEVVLNVDVVDPEGDQVTIQYSGWMTDADDGRKLTNYNDAGVYSVVITASDGFFEVQQTVRITVRDTNRPPVFVKPI